MKINIQKIKENKTVQELLEFGLINLDKPSGPTSFWTSQFVKEALNLKKTSHLGTLDPQVTGVLPVALNRACRLNDYFMHRDKKYVGIMRVHSNVDDDVLKKEMEKFVGKITQLPPKKSRVKRAERERTINRFEIIERDEKDVLFLADVQAGTYIRKLCSDLGERIGGAHMLELRRIKAGIFSENDEKYPSINLYEFKKAVGEYKKGNEEKLRKVLIPGEIITEILPIIFIRRDAVKKALTGSPLFDNFLEKEQEKEIKKLEKEEKICIFSDDNFIGCYRVVKSEDIFVVPDFVKN